MVVFTLLLLRNFTLGYSFQVQHFSNIILTSRVPHIFFHIKPDSISAIFYLGV